MNFLSKNLLSSLLALTLVVGIGSELKAAATFDRKQQIKSGNEPSLLDNVIGNARYYGNKGVANPLKMIFGHQVLCTAQEPLGNDGNPALTDAFGVHYDVTSHGLENTAAASVGSGIMLGILASRYLTPAIESATDSLLESDSFSSEEEHSHARKAIKGASAVAQGLSTYVLPIVSGYVVAVAKGFTLQYVPTYLGGN